MLLPDVNILIHAVNSDSPRHSHMLSWWDECLSGPTPVYLPWLVILGFVRITTNLRIFDSTLSLNKASGHIKSWLDQLGYF